jgi:hypothetical protein
MIVSTQIFLQSALDGAKDPTREGKSSIAKFVMVVGTRELWNNN